MNIKLIAIITVIAVLAMVGTAYLLVKRPSPLPGPVPMASTQAVDIDALLGGFKDVLSAYRKIIVLLADEEILSANERAEVERIGQALFHENQAGIGKLDESLDAMTAAGDAARFDNLHTLLTYVESDQGMFDADRLAFRELLQSMLAYVARDSSLPALKMHKRIAEDLDALAEIEHNYEKEIRQIFGRYDQRAIKLKRERWDGYLAHLKKLYTREQILKDYGVVMPYPEEQVNKTKKEGAEIFGDSLPRKTVALTFDDGPHNIYSAEIAAILKQ